jgi:hypothetical protein
MQVTTLGIDVSKNIFQLHGVDSQGKVVLTKRVSRAKILTIIAHCLRVELAWKPVGVRITGHAN